MGIIFIFATLVQHSATTSCGSSEFEYRQDARGTSVPTNITKFRENLGLVLDDLATNETVISLYRWSGVYFGNDSNAAYAQVVKWYEGSGNNTIYGLAQCSPDLSSGICATCFERIGALLEKYFSGIAGGNVTGPSCNYKYEILDFLNGTSLVVNDLSPPLPPLPSPNPVATASASVVQSSSPPPSTSATLVHHSADASCGTRYGEFIWDGSTNTSLPTNITEFKKNLNIALDDLPTNETKISLYRWVGVYSGVDPNAAYAQGRCIGYVDTQTCQNCIADITAMLRLDCSTENNSALLYHDQGRCMVQYSNHNMQGLLQMPDNLVFFKNHSAKVDPPSSVDAFYKASNKLFNALSSRAQGRPDDYQLFAAGKWYEGSSNNTIYGVAQCSPDLQLTTCRTCLERISTILEDYFNGIVGGTVLGPSCNYQYENFDFLNGTSLVVDDFSPPLPPPPPPPSSIQPVVPASSSPVQPTPPSTGAGANKALLVIYILVPLVVVSIIILAGILLFLMKKKKKRTKEVQIVGKLSDEEESIFEPGIKTEETLRYEFNTVSAATENFSEANMLGQGGFGAVYKGTFQNGEEIAVKRLSETSGQGEIEFKNEVTLLAKLQHRNLVRLLGFCLKKKERLLIYEFVANSSLDNYIFDPIKRANLRWDRLYKIIIGVTRGLLYLHEDSRLRIIHRDLKSSNVLLDNEMTPKIADFGMARLFLTDETQGNTNRIAGTYGYMAPEYAMHGLFSVKSDVFSFGVLLLEIVCGRRNTFFRIENSVEDLLSYTWKNWEEGTIINLLDPALRSETSSTCEITRCIHIGLLCAQEDDTQRPTMASVFNFLSNLSIALPVPSKPAFFQQRSIQQGTQLLQERDSGHNSNSSGSKNKSSMSWSTDTELYPR